MSVSNLDEFQVEAFRMTADDWATFNSVSPWFNTTPVPDHRPQWKKERKFICSKTVPAPTMNGLVSFEMPEAFPPYPSLGTPSLCGNVCLVFSSPFVTNLVRPSPYPFGTNRVSFLDICLDLQNRSCD